MNTITQNNTIIESFSKFTETKQSELFNKHKAFFAFGNKQFDEKREEGVQYVHFGHGLLVPKLNADQFNKDWNNLMQTSKIEYLQKFTKKQIIWHELSNHEAHISNDYEDAFEAVKHLGITLEEVSTEYRDFFNYQVEHDNF